MPSNVRFSEVKKMLAQKGYFLRRTNGSHHIFVNEHDEHFSIPVHNREVKYCYVRKIKKI